MGIAARGCKRIDGDMEDKTPIIAMRLYKYGTLSWLDPNMFTQTRYK